MRTFISQISSFPYAFAFLLLSLVGINNNLSPAHFNNSCSLGGKYRYEHCW